MASNPTAVASALPTTTTLPPTTPVAAPPPANPVVSTTTVNPAVAAVATSVANATVVAPTTMAGKANARLLSAFSMCCAAAAAQTALNDFDDAVDTMITVGGKTFAEAKMLILLANSHVSDAIFWLQAAQTIFAGVPQIANACALAITALQDFSLFVSGGQSIAAATANIPLPTTAADLPATVAGVQTAIMTAEAFANTLQANGVVHNLSQSDIAAVNSAVNQVATAANTFAVLNGPTTTPALTTV